MQKQPARLWITALLLGWFFDFLFFKHAPGISFAIYAIVTLLAGGVLLWLDGIRPARASLLLLPLILYFITVTIIRMEPLSAFLAHAITLFLMAGLAVTYRGGKWLRYSLADYFARALDLLSSVFARPLIFVNSLRKATDESGDSRKPAKQIWPILRGLIIAVPVVVFFAALLSSADLIFAQRLNDLTAIFRLENLPEYIFRFTYILVLAYILAGVYLHSAQNSTDEKLLGLEKPLFAPFLGFTEASIVLGSVVLLFTAFVIIQFQYFFGGQTNIHLDGYTYADYARKGFGELVTVAFFALLLFLGLTSIARRDTPARRKIFSAMGVALLTLVAIMLISGYQRLVLYENAYGFTRLRTYTHVFMIWIAVLLAAVVLLDLLQYQRAFALSILLASLGFATSLTLLNVDAFIFQRNLARFEQGQDFDVGYLVSLSPDLVPTIADEYEKPGTQAEIRDHLGAVLACIQDTQTNQDPDQSWQAFNFSKYQATRALQRVGETLKAYKLDHTSWPITVTTPLNSTYECSSSIMD